MRISDWSSDVCSSDLGIIAGRPDSASRQPIAQGRDVVAGVRCRGDEFIARALVRIGQCPKHRRARAGAAEGDGRPRQAIECGSEPRGVIVAERPRRHRSEERRGGKEGVSTCRSRWSPDKSKKKSTTIEELKDKNKKKQ